MERIPKTYVLNRRTLICSMWVIKKQKNGIYDELFEEEGVKHSKPKIFKLALRKEGKFEDNQSDIRESKEGSSEESEEYDFGTEEEELGNVWYFESYDWDFKNSYIDTQFFW